MKKLAILAVFALLLIAAVPALAAPAKDLYDGKAVGNSGFANFVPEVYGEEADVTGWVRYGKEGKAFHSTWVVDGLVPGGEYQLKLHSIGGDPSIKVCDHPNQYDPNPDYWECGDWGSETFLVMAVVEANPQGKINHSVKEDRLLSGDYANMQFIVTRNESPWNSAWTWENPAGENSEFTVK